MEDFGIFYGHGPFYGLLFCFMDIWYSLWKFGIFFPVLVFCTKKNLATLVRGQISKASPMRQSTKYEDVKLRMTAN
jgi:hypothetical protein